MKDLVTIGLPSKGRLKESSLNFLEKNNLKLSSKGGDRDYFADFDNLANAKVIYLHAREIIERLGDGTLDVGISGLDLLGESSNSLQKKVETLKELDFGKANLVVAVPDDWIDVQTVADLEEVSFYFRDKKNSRLRIATKYPNLTNKFFATKG
ncbi:MAG TPA: ATP phosphoribosyltransferase, partial [Pelagibacteraceae bacterium]|nr:ATP phosphoribosyltransferase [Pelagibacteraceae bacterium]